MITRCSSDPSDISPENIRNIFYRQIKSLSLKSGSSINDRIRTFDFQFSDDWLVN